MAKKYPNLNIINYDRLDYCSCLENLDEIKDLPNYKFVKGNICSSELVNYVIETEKIDTIMHFAAQTHVDNSFGNSFTFTQNNIMGTHVLLESAKVKGIKRFIHVSTDEVYVMVRILICLKDYYSIPFLSYPISSGTLESPDRLLSYSVTTILLHNTIILIITFTSIISTHRYGEQQMDQDAMDEEQILEPTNPYAATKAGAEFLAKSYLRSFNLPLIITRGNNVYVNNARAMFRGLYLCSIVVIFPIDCCITKP